MEKDLKKQLKIISMGTEDILTMRELEIIVGDSIIKKNPLKVKLGLDPTAPDIHLGHTVVLNKLRQFQDLGHKAILIIGDYTARIGDPSGRSSLRPELSNKEIDRNASTYMKQAFKILDPEKTELVKNSEWLKKLSFEDILGLTSRFTVARMLERDDFKKRFKGNIPIAIIEFMYPIMQAYDSVAVKADIELGGTDQRFNLLMGRELQKDTGQKPQIAVTMPILVGTDGTEKMSKSLGNYIGVSEKPSEIFGKIMSIPDNIMIEYFRLLTRLSPEDIIDIKEDIKKGSTNPSVAKRKLSRMIIEYLYSSDDAEKAEEEFDLIFKRKEIPGDIEEFKLNKKILNNNKIWIVKLMVDAGMAKSNGEARRLISQGAVKINGEKVEDEDLELEISSLNEKVLQRGKRYFKKIVTG
jgi:tyrosyl-tRNA synthetase